MTMIIMIIILTITIAIIIIITATSDLQREFLCYENELKHYLYLNLKPSSVIPLQSLVL